MATVLLRVSTFLILAANLASCVPMPHVAHLRPAVSGIIVEDGKPISGAELFLGKFPGNNQPCTDVGEVVPVSPEGIFSWAPVQEHNLTDSLLNPVALRGKLTVLCIRHPKKGVLIGITIFTKQDNPESLRLNCDVARPHTAGPMPGQAQHCEASTTN